MTLAERIEKLKQAKALIDEVVDDFDLTKIEEQVTYYILAPARPAILKTHLKFQQQQKKQEN